MCDDKPRCETCIYWGKFKGDPGHHMDGGLLRSCGNPHVIMGYGIEDEEVPSDGILVENDVGWAIIVGPRFGCVHHTPKPPIDPPKSGN